jgi:hypothetical protein
MRRNILRQEPWGQAIRPQTRATQTPIASLSALPVKTWMEATPRKRDKNEK